MGKEKVGKDKESWLVPAKQYGLIVSFEKHLKRWHQNITANSALQTVS